MVHDLMARHRGRQRFPIQDRGPFHAHLARDRLEIPQRPRREIVEDRDLVPRAEVLDEVGTDEPGAAGDEDARAFHGLAPHGRRRP
jgi:hypothetical protein